MAIVADIEDEWRRAVGADAWATFRRVLGHPPSGDKVLNRELVASILRP